METGQPQPDLTHYPPEDIRVVRGLVLSVGLHLLIAALICLIMYMLGIVSLRELMEKGGAIASSGPAPEQPMTIDIKLDDLLPPPTDQPEFVKQILKEKPVPVIVPKPPEPKPPTPVPEPKPVAVKPKAPTVVKTKAHITAPKATGSGNSSAVSGFVAGTSGLPHPSYPQEAQDQNEGGTVRMHVVFDGSGGIASVEVTGSSGVVLLDTYSRNFIYAHWKNPGLANQAFDVPFVYDLSSRTVR
jgi:TonB family protein